MESSIVGLAGVLIWTSEPRFSAMRRFYVETLGLRPRSDRPNFVNFQIGVARLTIGVHPAVDGISRDPLRIMINLAVADIDAAHERLSTIGVPCLRVPSTEPWGGKVATYADPDGNTVQLMTGTVS
ncbi:MAG TPA: VOC family protein [Acidimicrobiia bacterium]|nr:VOC family protein [Acidimicrobiia bacterium]